MTKNNPAMRQVAPNSSVRRRLFSDDDTSEQARIDNMSNALQEIMARDKEVKKQQWSFDFENDRPIEGGTYTWSLTEGPYDWVGKMTEKKTPASKVDEDEDTLRMRKENEETPKSKDDGASVAPEIRKRKKEGDVVVKEARRKISFD